MHSLDGDMTSRVERWEQRSEWPLAIAAVLFLGAYAWPILDHSLSPGWRRAGDVVDYLIWLVFVIDYVARIALADRRGHYFLRHILDLLIVTLPILRPLRLLRLVILLRVLNRRATDSLRGRVAIYVGGATVIILLCASLAVLDAERHSRQANITTFGDALWWSVTTVTTVGYGDHFPVTTEGRFVAVGLMLAGIALIGVVTASVATWLIDRVRQVEQEAQIDLASNIDALRAEVAALREQLAETSRPPVGRGGPLLSDGPGTF
jgi:voltage-gated potassium channel